MATISFGGVEVNKDYETIGDVKRDSNMLNFLGVDLSRVNFVVDGLVVGDDYLLDSDTLVEIVTVANTKGGVFNI